MVLLSARLESGDVGLLRHGRHRSPSCSIGGTGPTALPNEGVRRLSLVLGLIGLIPGLLVSLLAYFDYRETLRLL
jgi:hypothetical protein